MVNCQPGQLSHLVPNQNKMNFVIGRPGQIKEGQMKCGHLVPNLLKWHIGNWPARPNKMSSFGNKSKQMYLVIGQTK